MKTNQKCRCQVELWKKYINFEKSNPLRSEDTALVTRRVMFATEQCLLVLNHHPAVWHQAAQYLDQSSKLLTEKGVRKSYYLCLMQSKCDDTMYVAESTTALICVVVTSNTNRFCISFVLCVLISWIIHRLQFYLIQIKIDGETPLSTTIAIRLLNQKYRIQHLCRVIYFYLMDNECKLRIVFMFSFFLAFYYLNLSKDQK